MKTKNSQKTQTKPNYENKKFTKKHRQNQTMKTKNSQFLKTAD